MADLLRKHAGISQGTWTQNVSLRLVFFFPTLPSFSAFFLQPHSHDMSPHTLSEPTGPGPGLDVPSVSPP